MRLLRHRILTRLALAACVAGAILGPAQADKRVALVLGNSHYAHTATLANPAADAEDVTRALREIGFEVTTRVDADKRETDLALAAFARAAKGADAALFYYAGHGMQFRGRNYIMPTDAELEDEVSLRYQMTAVDDVKAALDGSGGVKVMILDACRNNPVADRFTRSIGVASRDAASTRGLARIDRSEGMVVAYATQADQVAQDGAGRNSPFAKAFLTEIREPGLEIGAMFRRIAANVYEQTGGRQVPELSISLLSDYALNQQDTDRTVWARIRNSSDPALFREFMRKFPASFFVPDAKARLEFVEQALPAKPDASAAKLRELEERMAERLAAAEAAQKRLAAEIAARDAERARREAHAAPAGTPARASVRERARPAVRERARPMPKVAAPVRERPRPAIASRPAPRPARPIAQAAPVGGGGRCFALNGRSYCE